MKFKIFVIKNPRHRALPHEMNLTAHSTKVWWWLLYSTKNACLNKFSQHGARWMLYRGAVSLILHKLHMKPSLRPSLRPLAAFYFRLFITIEEIYAVCMFSFFLSPHFWRRFIHYFIIQVVVEALLNNKKEMKNYIQDENKKSREN